MAESRFVCEFPLNPGCRLRAEFGYFAENHWNDREADVMERAVLVEKLPVQPDSPWNVPVFSVDNGLNIPLAINLGRFRWSYGAARVQAEVRGKLPYSSNHDGTRYANQLGNDLKTRVRKFVREDDRQKTIGLYAVVTVIVVVAAVIFRLLAK